MRAAGRRRTPDLTRIPRGEPGARLMLPGLLGLVGFALVVLLWWVLTLPGEALQPLAAASAVSARRDDDRRRR